MRSYAPHLEDEDVSPAGYALERMTQFVPTDTFLWLSFGSIIASLTLKVLGRERDALFVGQWAPTFLVLGVYTKLVRRLMD